MRRLIKATIMAALFAVLSFGSVAADPLNNPNAFQFTDLVCDNGQTVSIVTTNAAASGQIVTSTGVLIFRSGTGTFRDASNPEIIIDEFTFSIGKGKKSGLQDDLVTCTTTDITSFPGEIAEYEFVFTFVPRGQS